jgi:N-acetyl-anhydromuramyl-L-alanine amidase AmpD
MVDYSAAIPMYVPHENVFIDQNQPRWVVIHKTAQPPCPTAQDVAHYFAQDPARKSAHYIVGLDGTIVQCVAEKDGAGANCCLEAGHDSFWPTGINLNVLTISIEHVDPTLNNSTPVTEAQKRASFALVADICRRHKIAASHIVGHRSINPVTRSFCPGNYPLEELRRYVREKKM